LHRYSFISRSIALSLGSYAQSLLHRAYERLMPVAAMNGDLLIVQLGQIGDFVLTIRLIEALKKKHGDSIRVSVLIDSINSNLARTCEGIENTYVYDSEKYSRSQKRTAFPARALSGNAFNCALWLRGDMRTFRWLVAGRVPVRSVAVFPNPMRSSWMSLIGRPGKAPVNGAGGPIGKIRIGMNKRGNGKTYPHFVNSLMESGGIDGHEVEGQALSPKAALKDRATGERHDDRVFIHIGSGGELRRWPEERFAEVSKRLLELDGKLSITLIGAKSDYERAGRVLARIKHPAGRVVNGCGAFEIAGLKAVFEKGSLFIGLDSGPMHIAAFAGIPVVALMGPQSPEVFGPRSAGRERVVYKAYPCSPCWQFACVHNTGGGAGRCISDITAEEVFIEAKSLLKGGTSIEEDTATL